MTSIIWKLGVQCQNIHTCHPSHVSLILAYFYFKPPALLFTCSFSLLCLFFSQAGFTFHLLLDWGILALFFFPHIATVKEEMTRRSSPENGSCHQHTEALTQDGLRRQWFNVWLENRAIQPSMKGFFSNNSSKTTWCWLVYMCFNYFQNWLLFFGGQGDMKQEQKGRLFLEPLINTSACFQKILHLSYFFSLFPIGCITF